jgi:uncharacterized membrane protein
MYEKFVCFQVPHTTWRILVLGLFGGLGGSVIDSLLGATLQYSGYNEELDKMVNHPGPGVQKVSGVNLLTNNMVNLSSATITSALTALLAVKLL